MRKLFFSEELSRAGIAVHSTMGYGVSSSYVAWPNAIPENNSVPYRQLATRGTGASANYQIPLTGIVAVADPSQKESRAPTPVPRGFSWGDHIPLQSVLDQRACGCCWAIAAAGSIGDMLAVAAYKKGKRLSEPIPISPVEFMACTAECAQGCGSCGTAQAFAYSSSAGVHRAPPCASFETLTLAKGVADIQAALQCHALARCFDSEPLYKTSAQAMYGQTPLDIQSAMLEHGPITATMQVFRDFIVGSDPARKGGAFAETGGVYIHRRGQENYGVVSGRNDTIGFHSVVLTGWGNTRVPGIGYVPHWEVRNSWGTDWGTNGFCRIAVTSAHLQNGEVAVDVPLEVSQAGRKAMLGGNSFVPLAENVYGVPYHTGGYERTRSHAALVLGFLSLLACVAICYAAITTR